MLRLSWQGRKKAKQGNKGVIRKNADHARRQQGFHYLLTSLLHGFKALMPHWTIDGVKQALGARKISARELASEHYKESDARNPELTALLTRSQERGLTQAEK